MQKAIFGTILMAMFDILVIFMAVVGICSPDVKTYIVLILFATVACFMFKPHKDVIKWWINKLKEKNK